ncbi:MAG: L-2-hydroxyglutarate oxidase [Thermoanaerobaculia bacterium]
MRPVAVIGGGIVGLATAYELTRRGWPVVVLEKEQQLAFHQTGHNSGVIHSGVYYKPGSAKARTCTRGGELLRRFCDENEVAYRECGKLIVARAAGEVPALEELHRRGMANGVPRLELAGAERLREIEPHASGIRALYVPTAAIIDYREVCAALARRITSAGGAIHTAARVTAIRESAGEVVLESTAGAITVERYIACAGLQSDRVVRLAGEKPQAKIVPFRGEYFELVEEKRDLVRGLIYPVPDARFPFLGVHFTRTIHGGVEAGPNAVLARAREGYRKCDISARDLFDTFTYPGFWRLIAKYWRTAAGEVYRSLSKRAFVRALATLVPEITARDLVSAPAGIRAQALAPDGFLHDDFLIVEKKRSLHVCNAPSPAATASLAIAEEVASRAAPRTPAASPCI